MRRLARSIASILVALIAVQWQIQVACAQVANATSSTPSSTTSAVTHNLAQGASTSPISLDLSSTHATLTNSKLTGIINISVGNTVMHVTNSTVLTPAEYAASMQVLFNAHQSVILNNLGAAVGGTVNITNVTHPISVLSIPTAVTVVDNISQSTTHALTIQNGLINSGNLNIINSAQIPSTFTITAADISNTATGMMTALNTNLSLTAHSVFNAGTINAAALTMTAAQSISNTGIVHTSTNGTISAPSISNNGSLQAQQTLALFANQIINAGIMSSGNINIANLSGNSLSIAGTGGQMTAADSISATVNSYQTGNPALLITGGDYTAKTLLFQAANGALNVDAHTLEAPVSLNGATAFVGATSGNVSFGKVQLTADPIFYAGGDLDLSSFFPSTAPTYSTAGGDFVALAGGNILAPTAATNALLNTSGSTYGVTGGQVDIRAGVTFTITNAACTTCVQGTDYTVTGASSSGGIVDLSKVSIATGGGSVFLNAHAGTGSTGSIQVDAIDASARTPGWAPTGVAGGSIWLAGDGAVTAYGALSTIGFYDFSAGNITIDSAIGSYTISGLYVNSNHTCCNTWDNIGYGNPGSITFSQAGVTQTNPTINFTSTGESIVAWGSYATGSRPNISFTVTSDPQLGLIDTSNGWQSSASISITAPSSSLTTGGLTTRTFGAGATAGDITLKAAGAITVTSALDASGWNGAASAGHITLDSGTSTFNLNSIYAGAYSGCCNVATAVTPTSGLPGTVTFLQSGTPLTGAIPVTFAAGSQIELKGNQAAATESIDFQLQNSNALGDIDVSNGGTGNAGSVILNGTTLAGQSVTTQNITASAHNPGSLSGAIVINSNSSITTGNLTTAGMNNANANTITLNSPTATFNLGSLYANSSNSYSAVNNGTGSGRPSTITWTQSGVPISTPNVTFATGADIRVDGTLSTPTQALTIQTLGNTTLGNVSTSNLGTANSGLININSTGSLSTTGTVSTLAPNQLAGTIQLTANGALSTAAVEATGSNNSTATVSLLTDPGSSGTITVNGAVTADTTITLTPDNLAAVTISNTGSLSAPTVAVTTNNLTDNGSISAAQAFSTVSTGNLAISGSGNFSSGTQSTFQSAAGGTISTSGALTGTGMTLFQTNGGTVSATSGTFKSSGITFDAATVSNTATVSTTANQMLFQNTAGGATTITNNGAFVSAAGFNTNAPTTLTITNNGSISSGAASTINASQNISISGGAGSSLLGTGGLAFNSTNGSVSGNQDTVSNPVGGSANTTYSFTTNVSSLAIGTTTAKGNISFSGAAGDSVAAGSTITAGTILAGDNPRSTNFSDYSASAITSPGQVSISAPTGNITVGNSVGIYSRGADVAINATAGSVSIGTAGTIMAQGANVTVYGGTSVNINGGSIVAVARATGGPPITIDGQSVPNFQGGGIAVYSSMPGANPDADITNASMNRLAGGSYFASTAVNTSGSWFSYYNAGSTINLTIQGGGSLSAVNSSFNGDGGVFLIDPPTSVSISGVSFLAVEPGLTAPPLPPTPSPAAPVLVSPALPVASTAPAIASISAPASVTINTGSTSSITPVDQNKAAIGNTVTQPIVTGCVPRQLEIEGSTNSPTSWSIASGSCEAFSYRGSDGLTIVAAGGTQVAPTGQGALKVGQGKLFACSGDKAIEISTGQGIVLLPSNSSALIERKPSGVTRIEMLTGETANVQAAHSSQSFQAKPGEEIVISDDGVSDEELIPTDGVDRVTVTATIKVATVSVAKNSFDVPTAMKKERLINCTSGCLPDGVRARISKTKTASLNSQHSQRISFGNSIAPISAFRPVSFTAAESAGSSRLNTFTGNGVALRFDRSGKWVVRKDKSVELISGDFVVQASRDVTILSGRTKVSLLNGDVLIVSKASGSTRYQLASHAGSREGTLQVDRTAYQLRLGQEILVAQSESALSKAKANDTVAHRRIRMEKLPSGAAVICSEVSFVSMVGQMPILKSLFASSEVEDVAISSRLAKSAVAISLVTNSHGPFSAGLK